MILSGDCLLKLKELEADSIDSVVTDPPYGLSFMGKRWDYDVPSVDIWREVLRVLKPGGHVLAFGGTRTYHRLVVNIEDAGFEIRDQLQWIYGSGFPKSHNLKEEWQGWGTALKPANEPIVLARKPLSEKTVSANVLRWGTGAINVDESRVGTEKRFNASATAKKGTFNCSFENKYSGQEVQGRWPANILFDEAAAEMLDEQSVANGIHSAGKARPRQKHIGDFGIREHGARERLADHRFDDSKIGASRFFYVAKASKSERNRGLEGMPESARHSGYGDGLGNAPTVDGVRHTAEKNFHPTVKPVKLMQYLIKLITPPSGTVLDPFMGSGSTGVAAFSLNFKFIGIELNPEYTEIAKKRIEHEQRSING